MEVNANGKLTPKDHIYLYGLAGDLNVEIERNGSLTGSIFSGGNIWMIVGSSLIVIAGIAAAVIISKRKKKQ